MQNSTTRWSITLNDEYTLYTEEEEEEEEEDNAQFYDIDLKIDANLLLINGGGL